METVSLKLDSALARELESGMKSLHYSTKTEFIREAIRDRLAQIREQQARERAWARLFAMRGAFKGKALARTKEEERQLEERIDRELRAHYEKKFGIKLT